MIYDMRGKEFLTAYDISRETGLHLQTVYKRFKYGTAKDKWKVRVVKDRDTGKHKYAVAREDFEKIWVKTKTDKLTEGQKRLLSD